MAESTPLEKVSSPPATVAEKEGGNKKNEEETRVNSRASARPGSDNENTIGATDESKYHLPTRRLLLVHTGVLL